MTQPIQEPLTQRSISTLTWGQNQLFRRPDPFAGGGSLPYAWMIWDEGGDIPADDSYAFFGGGSSLENIAPWSYGYNAPGTEFGVDMEDGIRLGPADYDHRTPMHVLIDVTVSWGDNWANGDLYLRILMRQGTSSNEQGWGGWDFYGKTHNGLLGFDESISGTVVVTLNEGTFTNSWVSGILAHSGGGGSDRFVGRVSLGVTKLSDYPYPGGEFTT